MVSPALCFEGCLAKYSQHRPFCLHAVLSYFMSHPLFVHNDYRYSPAMAGDFLEIAALDREIWKGVPYGEVIPDGEHAWRIWCEHALLYTARDASGLLAGAILAFPGVKGEACVHKVMVAKEHQGRGVGSLLFALLLEEIDRQKVQCFLTVSPGNPAAIALYRKLGFMKEQFVAGFYRESEDRLVMTRPAV